jgi:hypothetical protein
MPEHYTDRQPRNETRDPGLRAGDRDRDAVADVLREQHLAGRLDTDEFQTRLDRCYAAKTFGDLDELVADLPRAEPGRPVRRAWRWPAVAIAALLLTAITLSHGHLLWLVIPVFFFVGRPLLWRSAERHGGWGVVGCAVRQTSPRGTHV